MTLSTLPTLSTVRQHKTLIRELGMTEFKDFVQKNSYVPDILRTVRFCVVVFASFGYLWLNASHFDATELKAITGIVLTYLAAESGSKVIENFRTKKE